MQETADNYSEGFVVQGRKAMSDHKAFVDIIIPVYNTCDDFIKRCLNSIDHADDRVHVILVDDGSKEATARFLDALALESYKTIEVIHKINGGQSSARQQGLRHSTAEYITFLDSDDYLDWPTFSKVIDLAVAKKPQILSFEYTEISEEAIRPNKKRHATVYEERDASDYVIDHPSLWSVLFRRDSIFEDDFCVGPIMGEDIATAIPIVLRAQSVAVTDYDAYRYYRNSQSVSQRPNIRAVVDIMDAMDFMASRCSLLRCDYHDVVEWTTVLHVLCYAAQRYVDWYGPNREMKNWLFHFVETRFPNWKSNPQLTTNAVSKAPSFMLLTRGKWRLYYILKKISGRGHKKA